MPVLNCGRHGHGLGGKGFRHRHGRDSDSHGRRDLRDPVCHGARHKTWPEPCDRVLVDYCASYEDRFRLRRSQHSRSRPGIRRRSPDVMNNAYGHDTDARRGWSRQSLRVNGRGPLYGRHPHDDLIRLARFRRRESVRGKDPQSAD